MAVQPALDLYEPASGDGSACSHYVGRPAQMLHDLIIEAAVPLVSIKFVEEINHRVVNEFAEAISGLSLAAANSPSQQARESLDAAATRLLAHADLHRSLLQPSAAGRMNLADYLSRI